MRVVDRADRELKAKPASVTEDATNRASLLKVHAAASSRDSEFRHRVLKHMHAVWEGEC